MNKSMDKREANVKSFLVEWQQVSKYWEKYSAKRNTIWKEFPRVGRKISRVYEDRCCQTLQVGEIRLISAFSDSHKKLHILVVKLIDENCTIVPLSPYAPAHELEARYDCDEQKTACHTYCFWGCCTCTQRVLDLISTPVEKISDDELEFVRDFLRGIYITGEIPEHRLPYSGTKIDSITDVRLTEYEHFIGAFFEEFNHFSQMVNDGLRIGEAMTCRDECNYQSATLTRNSFKTSCFINCSEDGTPRYIRSYEKPFKLIKVLVHPNSRFPTLIWRFPKGWKSLKSKSFLLFDMQYDECVGFCKVDARKRLLIFDENIKLRADVDIHDLVLYVED